MTDRELMQQALHTLEGWANHGEWVWPESALEQAKRNTTESIAALRERLAQPEQEPVKPFAWANTDDLCADTAFRWCEIGDHKTPVYKFPPQRPWVGLTDEERNSLWRDVIGWGDPSHDDEELMKAIEAKLKEKNA